LVRVRGNGELVGVSAVEGGRADVQVCRAGVGDREGGRVGDGAEQLRPKIVLIGCEARGGLSAVPTSDTLAGDAASSEVNSNVACCLPVTVGAKTTSTVQVASGAIVWPVQWSESAGTPNWSAFVPLSPA